MIIVKFTNFSVNLNTATRPKTTDNTMEANKSDSKILDYDTTAYEQRGDGYSPDFIRDAVWNLVKDSVHGSVLDAGSGSGGWIRQLQQSSQIKSITSVDIVDDGASQISGVKFHIADLSMKSLPCEDESLDWIFAIEVIEHLANPRNFIRESARCLKPGGKLVISTPYNESLKAKLSFVLRGYFPAFCDHIYHLGGHITPIFEIDLRRMSTEAQFNSIELHNPPVGEIPKTHIRWQSIFPWLTGKLWTDCLIGIMTK
jgi:2-polyprenyl-3-methyl-5-hydroxy-6-metoxy-1,4-benzoquinol methylase